MSTCRTSHVQGYQALPLLNCLSLSCGGEPGNEANIGCVWTAWPEHSLIFRLTGCSSFPGPAHHLHLLQKAGMASYIISCECCHTLYDGVIWTRETCKPQLVFLMHTTARKYLEYLQKDWNASVILLLFTW